MIAWVWFLPLQLVYFAHVDPPGRCNPSAIPPHPVLQVLLLNKVLLVNQLNLLLEGGVAVLDGGERVEGGCKRELRETSSIAADRRMAAEWSMLDGSSRERQLSSHSRRPTPV